jgi:sodium/pantothenate symporter
MLLIGRATMVVAAVVAVVLASLRLDILEMLVFIGALWGAIVFPVLASVFWPRVTNAAFTSAVLSALAIFTVVRFEWLPLVFPIGETLEVVAAVGGGVVIGIMTFAFLGLRPGLVTGSITALVLAPVFAGFLRHYTVLMASLIAYGVSTIVCLAVSLVRRYEFDFSHISQIVQDFEVRPEVAGARDEQPAPGSVSHDEE